MNRNENCDRIDEPEGTKLISPLSFTMHGQAIKITLYVIVGLIVHPVMSVKHACDMVYGGSIDI